ncbi:hypothetical protein SATMO3_35970 [Sporomusa aerivorans]
MDLKKCKAFVRAIDTGSFPKAADSQATRLQGCPPPYVEVLSAVALKESNSQLSYSIQKTISSIKKTAMQATAETLKRLLP